MSAIAEDGPAVDGPAEVVKVLFALYPGVDALDFVGPLEVLSAAQHKPKDVETKAFECVFAGAAEHVEAKQGCTFKAHIDFKEAHRRLREFDVLVIPGGSTVADIVKDSREPVPLIKAFGELQTRDPARERTLLSVCRASLLLGQAGVLQGLAATTHPDAYIQLEKICQTASAHVSTERTDVMEERYVVNNGRFDLGDLDENPFVIDKRILSHKEQRRRSSMARKGSNAWKESNNHRDSVARRAAMRLGGLRVITSGGAASGLDSSLYLVSAMVSDFAAQEVARLMQYSWVKGVVVDAIDV